MTVCSSAIQCKYLCSAHCDECMPGGGAERTPGGGAAFFRSCYDVNSCRSQKRGLHQQ